MTHRDDDYSHVPGPHSVAIGRTSSSDALVLGNGGPHLPVGYPGAAPMPRQPEVITGGMDQSWFYHSLRRRWLLALCMGLVLAATTAGLLWYLFPESSSAVALFQVASEEPSLVFRGITNDTESFEILQRTQLALLKSYFVLSEAVRDPNISRLDALAGEDDPIQWLTERVSVNFLQESEILKIELTGDEDSEDLRNIVDAVAAAYTNMVIFEDRKEKLNTRDVLMKSLTKINDEIRRNMQDFRDLAEEIGSADADESDSETRLLLAQITDQMRLLTRKRSEMLQLQTQYQMSERELKDPALMEARIDEMLAGDTRMQYMQNQALGIDLQIQDLQTRSRRMTPTISRLIKQRQAVQQQMAQYRRDMKQQMLASQQGAPNVALQQLQANFRILATAMAREIAMMQQAMEASREELAARGEQSVELQLRKAELEQLQEVANDMALKIESWDVEMNAPQRITQIQPAQITPRINTMQRYLIATFGGLTAFGLTCFAIAYIEFRNRRLNGPGQVDEGLGIRVVGTLPALSSRRLLDPNHPLVAQLTESIDSVRTLLMHDSTSKPRQVVMITSAMTLEGRTTVASQLAASLARAGRRTLLVDGDLRRPALHALFDLPLEDGLCEVLRAEVDVSDAIRPTHAEGLWLLTAGYCDVDAVQALATDQLQPVFEKLRSEYDFVIIDAAPVLGLSDSLLFGQYCDGALLSVLRDHSEVPKIYQAAELLRGVGVRLIGSVVNGVSTKSDGRITQLRLVAPKHERQQLQAS